MFTASAMKAVCSHDQEMYRSQTTFNDSCEYHEVDGSCCPAWSLGHMTALIVGKDSCDVINDDDVTFVRTLLQECVNYYSDGCLGSESTCANVPANCSAYNSVYTLLHFLTPTEFAASVAEGTYDLEIALVLTPQWKWSDESYDFFVEHMGADSLNGGSVKVIAIGGGFKYELFSSYILPDSLFICIGCVFVVLIMWIYVGSLFVTVMTLLSILMSMIVAYFLYYTIFRIPFFPFMNLITAILVIGVGADDCFVYVDIWKLAKERLGGGRDNLAPTLRETLKHAATTMFVTSFTTSTALFSGAVSSITAIRCFSIFAGSSILVNLVLTLTWIPAAVIIHDKYFVCEEADGASKNRCCACISAVRRIYDFLARTGNKVFEVYLPIIVNKLRIFWIVLLSGLGVGGFCVVFVAPRLRLPSASEFMLFRTSHILEQYDQIYKEKFAFEGDSPTMLPAMVVWGIKALDNSERWDPDSRGTTVMDETFNLTSPEAQEWLYDFCTDFRASSFHDNTTDSSEEECFIDSFRSFMEGSCVNPINGNDLSPCCGQTSFPYSSALFTQCAVVFYGIRCQLYPCHLATPGLRFNADDDIVAMYIYLQTNTAEALEYSAMNQFWTDVDGWVENRLSTAPEGMRNGWFLSVGDFQFYFFDLQRGLATGAPLAVGVSLALAALVLLLSIRNVLVTFYAMFTIACAVFVVIGSVVLLGWELNIMESTNLSLAVGLSVDFTIHLGVAYRQVDAHDRETRSLQALRTLGAAITMAALTTFTAGAFMMPATVLSYVQLGTFLMLEMSISWFYGVFLFVSLCRTIGPQGTCAQISKSCCRCDSNSITNTEGVENNAQEKDIQTDDEIEQPG